MPEPEVPDLSFEEACKELTGWTKALLYEVEHRLPEMQTILAESNGKTFPSRQQQALLVFRGVTGKLFEVQEFVKMVERVVRESSGS